MEPAWAPGCRRGRRLVTGERRMCILPGQDLFPCTWPPNGLPLRKDEAGLESSKKRAGVQEILQEESPSANLFFQSRLQKVLWTRWRQDAEGSGGWL